jgi:glycine/D-amino acid oxidase-like deaminating enzyme
VRFSTTCRYELSPDSHFIAAPHPDHPTVWLLGGGSGHGFKHGPAMAERMAAALRGGAGMPERFRLGERAVGQSMRTSGSGR